MFDFAYARQRMIECHVARRGIDGPGLLRALDEVPREVFVDPGFEKFAYEDRPLPIGEGQTISQPYIVALMIDRAGINPAGIVLEVGTGSGYAAAVLSRLAGQVYTIERHPALAENAKRRLRRLGYENVVVRIGDGSRGWPEAAPFDAILVAAGGRSVPSSLKEQLSHGGRLIMPIGPKDNQRLVRVTRMDDTSFEEEDLGGVRFVPLVGEHGWGEASAAAEPRERTLPELIAEAAEPLPPCDDPRFGALFDRFADRRVVLLGEASHGTSEFYLARAAITRRLVEEHGFNIVAVEADWPDAAVVDRHVRGGAGAAGGTPFQRFPTWMWRNQEVLEFIGWMRAHNSQVGNPSARAGFYGLDLYNMSGSIAAVLAYLDRIDSAAARIARERYGCLTPWQSEPSTYGRAALIGGYGRCEAAVISQCRELLERHLKQTANDGGELLDAAQNARLVAAAERYYRIMYYGGAESWNLRGRHMYETLKLLLDARGPRSKAVVWAHNSHVGDARHTDMGSARDEVNIGQLCRERFGDQAALIGFGTHEGEVAAASEWNGELEIKTIRPSLEDSYETLFHQSGKSPFLLDMTDDCEMRRKLLEPRLERFIGVIYRPETERLSHYMYASLPGQFDAFVWFNKSNPVAPLAVPEKHEGLPDTYPFGM